MLYQLSYAHQRLTTNSLHYFSLGETGDIRSPGGSFTVAAESIGFFKCFRSHATCCIVSALWLGLSKHHSRKPT